MNKFVTGDILQTNFANKYFSQDVHNLEYYGATKTRSTLVAALTEISSTKCDLWVNPGTWDLDGGAIIVPENVRLVLAVGAILKWTGAYTITIKNLTIANGDLTQHFDCPVTNVPVLKVSAVYPEWFDEITDEATCDCVPAFQMALATGCEVYTYPRTYHLITDSLYANRRGHIVISTSNHKIKMDKNTILKSMAPTNHPNVIQIAGVHTHSTTVSSTASKNQNIVNVNLASGLTAGDYIVIWSSSTNMEICQIYSKNVNELTLYTYLTRTYSAGAEIIKIEPPQNIEITGGKIDGNQLSTDCINITTGINIKIYDVETYNTQGAGRGIIAETYSKNINVENCRCHNTNDNAIEYYDTVVDSSVTGCVCYRSTQDGIKLHGINNNMINNVCYSNRHGLSINDTDNCSCIGNRSYSNLENGLFVSDATGQHFITVHGNSIYGNLESGIRIIASSFFNISENRIYNNYEYGIIMANSIYFNLSKNCINYNIIDGANVDTCYYGSIDYNIMRQNGAYGLKLITPTNVYENFNQYIDNTSGAISGTSTIPSISGLSIGNNSVDTTPLTIVNKFDDAGLLTILLGMYSGAKKFAIIAERTLSYARGLLHLCVDGAADENTADKTNAVITLTSSLVKFLQTIELGLGKTLKFNKNSNSTIGEFTANGTSAVVVSNTCITDTSIIVPILKTVGGTVGHPYVDHIDTGTSFDMKSQALDTSTYYYIILESYT